VPEANIERSAILDLNVGRSIEKPRSPAPSIIQQQQNETEIEDDVEE